MKSQLHGSSAGGVVVVYVTVVGAVEGGIGDGVGVGRIPLQHNDVGIDPSKASIEATII